MYILVLAALFLSDLLTQNPVRKGWRKSSASIWQNSVDSFENMRRTACRQMLRNVDFALSDWMASRCQWRSSRKYKTEAPNTVFKVSISQGLLRRLWLFVSLALTQSNRLD
mmetsp:Transcript_93931/g.130386  ORF Transcript_93931/g.130386 Transcript_93931/m.130386 type:complete len:111 (+) Transcript_93931:682-1014(+)